MTINVRVTPIEQLVNEHPDIDGKHQPVRVHM